MGLSSRLQTNVHLHKQHFEHHEETVTYSFKIEIYLFQRSFFLILSWKIFKYLEYEREQYNEP